MYGDGAREIVKGCNCGGKLFFYVSNDAIERAKEITTNLSKKDKKQIENDVYDMIGDRVDKDAPVVLDIESIRILKPGKFEIDLVNLFKKKHPLVYKLEEGKYVIDIASTFQMMDKE